MPVVAKRAPRPDAATCAAQIIAVVPGVMDALRASMRRNIGEALSVPQFRCLGFIARNPGCSVSEVAAFLGVTLPTASAMVDRLVRAAHVVAATSAADRRRSELRVNAPGKALLDRIRSGARRDMAAALGDADADELAAVLQALELLHRVFANDRVPEVGATL
ncbi:MAG TPA: MarR family transcriptional regulator [Burkholderiaceae bacterium]|nr:MarR family transcriptional regulator [Burkholderiaceae bacterium]